MGLTGRANQWTHTKPKLHWLCRGSSAVLSGRTHMHRRNLCPGRGRSDDGNRTERSRCHGQARRTPAVACSARFPCHGCVNRAVRYHSSCYSSCLRGGKSFLELAQTKKRIMAGVGILFTQVPHRRRASASCLSPLNDNAPPGCAHIRA